MPENGKRKRPIPGFVFYDGPSLLDGRPIVGIVTLQSKNAKTGPMLQTWILCKNRSPMRAINTGSDRSVCGNCPMRGTIDRTGPKHRNRGRGCYVNVAHAPTGVWGAYARGSYPRFNTAQHTRYIANRALRLGSYGDPAAIPLVDWGQLTNAARGWSGYTYQWRNPNFDLWKRFVMASAHSVADAREAQALGWRTFRSRLASQPVLPSERICPASAEGGNRASCYSCLACRGGNPSRGNITIIAHGSPSNRAALEGIHATE